MTTIENSSQIKLSETSGIYLLEMTATENNGFNHFKTNFGIYLLEMTTIENYKLQLTII